MFTIFMMNHQNHDSSLSGVEIQQKRTPNHKYFYRNTDGLGRSQTAQITAKHGNTKIPLELAEMSGKSLEFAKFSESEKNIFNYIILDY